MPFIARFSCYATTDFNSILIYLPRRLWWQILYQNLWNVSDYWSVKGSRGLFLFERNEKKNGKGTLTPKMPFDARLSCCAMVVLTSPVKCLFPTFQVCTLWLVALFQQGAHHLTLGPLFVSFWDMMKCIFLHSFLLLYSLSCEQASREQVSLILVAAEVGRPIVSGVLQLMTSMSYCALPFRWIF